MYTFKTKGKYKLEQYSGSFKTKQEYLKWYNKHGKFLEKTFNRELVLIKD